MRNMCHCGEGDACSGDVLGRGTGFGSQVVGRAGLGRDAIWPHPLHFVLLGHTHDLSRQIA